jgi:hypothetical protein
VIVLTLLEKGRCVVPSIAEGKIGSQQKSRIVAYVRNVGAAGLRFLI